MPTIGVKASLRQTKLYRPPVTEDYVPRVRLCAWLEQIVQRPLTLISAPAGYGKSTLMSACLENSDIPNAWLSLDENDNDLGTFASYFLASIQGLHPTFGIELLSILESANLPPIRFIAGKLCNEFEKLDEEIVLVLDDYGLIHNQEVHALITDLLHHPHPLFHLVLLTRHDPPLPLSDWRARNQMVEIRSPELRFTLAEAASFLRQAASVQLDDGAIAALNEQTEGWAAGLRLAALSFSRNAEFQTHIDELSGSNVYIKDYLFSQVLTRLADETQQFLLQTSILDRLCASLSHDVAMPDNSLAGVQAMLLELEAANAFVIPLDDSRHWFRYHHLFQDFLLINLNEQYPSEFVASLHLRASAWYSDHGFIEEALRHAISANDMESAVKLVAANRHELFNQESYRRLSRWLGMFPQEIVEGSPELLLIQARFAQTVRFDIAELYQLVGKIDVLIEQLDLEPEHAIRLAAENDALRAAALFYMAPDPQVSLTYAKSALDRLPQDWYVIRSYCWMFGAVAQQMLGDFDGAYAWTERGRSEDLTASDGPKTRNGFAEGFVYSVAANLNGLQQVGEFILGVTTNDGQWETHGWVNHFLAIVHYHRNDLERAQRHARQTFDHRYYHPSANVDSAFILIMIQQALGEPEEARKMLKIATDYAVEMRSKGIMRLVRSFQAELAVLQGRAREVLHWAEQAYTHMQLAPMVSFYAPSLTIAKVLLAADTPDGRTMAADCLQRIHEYAESKHHVRVLIEVLALEALLQRANKNEEAAFAALERSLSLAQPGGFIRLYVDLGPEIADLLRRMQHQESYSEYVASILSAFADASQLDLLPEGNGQLIEPLTRRELEILELLARRYSNKEIAAELFISPETVKRHAINLYQKLAVHNRREAVETAAALGLIPSL